jgi:hypothetical protein
MWKVMYGVAVLALAWVVCLPLGVSAYSSQEVDTSYYSGPDFQTQVAQFITLCSASTLAEKLTTFSPFQSPSPAKTRTSSRPFRAHGHHLRPSTTYYKLSDRV